jgi:Zn-dependent M28 family amino/carboxypeptidase
VKARIALYAAPLVALLVFVAYATVMPGTSQRTAPPAPSPEERTLAAALESRVTALAHDIGERRVGHGDSLERAERYLESSVRALPQTGHASVRVEDVGADGSHAKNVIFEVPGTSSDLVVIGAHYDSAVWAPGADDNASGVAVGLELARRFATAPARNTLRFVWFANEEQPYFQRPGMGSLAHAQGCRARSERVSAMLSLESLGYYSNASHSQQYPWPLDVLYPDQGNFVAFVGSLGNRSLVRRAIGTFRASAPLPSEGAALPANVPGVAWSDHWAFAQLGYPAIMLTDTAPYRNPHYHESSDTPATLDYVALARVTLGVAHVLEELAGKR